MNLVIKVSSAEASSNAKALTSELAKTEDGAKNVGTAGARAMGEVAAGAAKATESVKATGKSVSQAYDDLKRFAAFVNPFAALNAQFEREVDILERLRGPMREYRADMDALEMLFKRGVVSAAEYDNELQRLIRTQGAMHGPVRQAAPEIDAAKATATIGLKAPNAESSKIGEGVGILAGQFGTAGTALVEFTSKGTLAVGMVAALTAGAVHLGNEYIELANKAQKLTASGGSVNETLREQLDLSLQLHGRLDGTMELYDAVRDGTDELNLSQREQIDLTRDIGAAVVASGKNLEQAGGLMSKLTFAFASGSIGGRELRGIMKEFPDIGAAFVTTLGYSRKELVQMANEGQLSADMLISAFNRMGPEMLEKVGKKAETTGQMWGHFKDEVVLSLGRLAESSGIFELIKGALEGLAAGIRLVADLVSLLREALGPLISALGAALDGIKFLVKATFDLGQALGSVLEDMSPVAYAERETIGRQAALARAYLARAEAVKLLGVEEERNARVALIAAAASRSGISLGPVAFDEGSANRWAEARITLKQAGIDIGAAFDKATTKAQSLDAEIEKIKNAKAAELIAEDAKKIWYELSHTNDVLVGQTKNWKDLLDRVRQYNDALDKIKADHKQFPGMAITRDDVDIVRGARDAQLELDVGLGRYGKTILEAKHRTNEHKDALTDLNGAYKQGALTFKEYSDGLAAIGYDMLTAEELFKQIQAPAKLWSETLGAINYLFRVGSIDAATYNQEMAKLAKTSTPGPISPREPVGPRDFGGLSASVSYEPIELLDRYGEAQAGLQPILDDTTKKYIAQMDAYAAFMKTLRDADEEEALGRRKALLQAVTRPQEEYRKSLVELEHVRPSLNADQYADALDRIRAGYLSASDEGKTFSGAMELQWIKLKDEADRFGATLANVLVSDLDKVNNAFIEMANGGEVSWGRMVDVMIQDLQRLILKQLEMQAIAGFVSLAGGSTGAGPTSPLGFATGGSFVVGGSGGVDTTPVNFMATRGERVTIQTPHQQRSAGAYPSSNGGGAVSTPAAPAPAQNFRIVNVIDPSVVHAALDSPDGERIVMNHIRKNQSALRGAPGR